MTTDHPAPESERYAVKRIIHDGFNNGSSSTAIADAILSRRTSELDAASNACLQLAAAHGLATGHGDTVADMIRELFDGLLSRRGGPVAWRCFHCDEVFSDADSAREHFGYSQMETPGCKLNEIEGGLLGIVRRQEEQLRKFYSEETASYREFYALGAEHSQALRREEEKGYARGLADASPPAPALDARTVEVLEKIVSEWDKCNEQELQLDEGVEQAIEAGRALLVATRADRGK
jgi:hypothetical protein